MNGSTTSPPISSHPAFPAAVILWFAALLGLPFLVIPQAMLDNIAALAGLDALLGSAARLALAGAGAGLGVLLGSFVVWRIALSQRSSIGDEDDVARAPVMADIPDPGGGAGIVAVEHGEVPASHEGEDGGFFPAQAEEGETVSAWGRWRADIDPANSPSPAGQGTEHDVSEAPPAEVITPEAVSHDDDEQRRAADLLVAGLPSITREEFADEPADEWPGGGATESDEEVDGSFAEDEAPAADEGRDVEHLSPRSTAEDGEPADGNMMPEHEDDLASLGLDQLVARLERAMEDMKKTSFAPPAESSGADFASRQEDGDPVIAFLRREAMREGGHGPRAAAGESAAAHAGLRSALERLDQVSSRGRS